MYDREACIKEYSELFFSLTGRKEASGEALGKEGIMAKEELKGYLKQYVESVTEKSQGADKYICPLCGSGKGKNKTGAFSITEQSWKCFSCDEGGDIFDLIGKLEHISDYKDQQQWVAERFGGDYQISKPAKKNIHTTAYTQKQDYTSFFVKAHSNIGSTDYPQQRGLSQAVLERFQIGYVEHWKHPKAPNAKATPRLIIPTGPHSYLARDTRAEVPEGERAYTKQKVGSTQLFNTQALDNTTEPIFIVEGEIDALSIVEAKGEAIALGGVGNVKKLLELLEAKEPVQPFILALDNDARGQEASQELQEGLEALQLEYWRFNPAGAYKDSNEALQRNREAFTKAVQEGPQLRGKEQREEYLQSSAAHYIEALSQEIQESLTNQAIPTGFKELDKILEGGLYDGLYILGAISSLGKTTLCLQVADQIAKQGHDVLIFSLEMRRAELMAKSISRHTIQITLEGNKDSRNAKTTRGILAGVRYRGYNKEEQALIAQAVEEYRSYAQHIFISEGIGDIGVDQIRQAVNRHYSITGIRPIVVIDYLQILAPFNERSTDKQNTDKAVLELKRLARDYKIPVIGISSFNRASYADSAKMAAFKESGAIEYSSDVLIGLNFKSADKTDSDYLKEKRKDPREIELTILKNRNGRTGDSIAFKYYPLFNFFAEDQR